ncbi:UNVERIFIED_CONTAM: hypothetical protein GTU68_039244 [Idotea baltica]|nr:hypothetical protein [Idotea baltica]
MSDHRCQGNTNSWVVPPAHRLQGLCESPRRYAAPGLPLKMPAKIKRPSNRYAHPRIEVRGPGSGREFALACDPACRFP